VNAEAESLHDMATTRSCGFRGRRFTGVVIIVQPWPWKRASLQPGIIKAIEV
jgi:hypothetical protein